uniref:CSON003533 protein n=1 Tax=Culicoides sonorensis TaxID=179676 RepID=A0A336MLM4_CULSO
MPFHRFLPPEYGDGIETFRKSIDGSPLPSARFVSLVVHGDREDESQVTLMLPQWGQFIDHDLTATKQPKSINGSIPSCCHSNELHPACMPIKVPEDDPWLAPLGVRCLEFLRSAPASRHDCFLSWREQTNQASSFLDASVVYSSNPRLADNARIFRDGLLVFGKGATRDDVCRQGAITHGCVRAGDTRNGEQPGLLAMHTVFVAEHNRIALELSDMNFHWSDEKLYQETRRIISAMIQHITFREFLPLVLGREVMRLFDLELRPTGYYEGYDSSVNPTIANGFSGAAFRFGHSMVQSTIMRSDRNNNFIKNNVSLHEESDRGDMGGPGSLHRLLRGLANQRAQRRDEFISAELTNHLFQSSPFPFGLDLAAINVQRGRDHGIPSYVSWRGPCGLSKIKSWEDIEQVMGPRSAQRLKLAYKHVEDIDLFVAGLAERPVSGGLVGPTFACIIAQQFSNLRKGDRFWYENSNFESSFTPGQLQSIRQTSLAQIICRTLETGTLQPHVFLPHDFVHNQRKACGFDELAPIDLTPWREHDPFKQNTPNKPTHDDLKLPESPFSISNNEISNKLDLTRPLRPSENLIGTNDKLNEIEHQKPLTHTNDKLTQKKTRTTTRVPSKIKTKPTMTTTVRPVIDNKLDFETTRRLNGTRTHKTRTTTVKSSKRTKRKVRRTKRKTSTLTTTTTTLKPTTLQTRRNDGWIVINEDDGQRLTTKNPAFSTNRRTTIRGWVLLENRKLKTEHGRIKRDMTDNEKNKKLDIEGHDSSNDKISDLIDFDSLEREQRKLKNTTTHKTSRIFPIRYNLLNKRVTTKKTTNTLINDKLERLKSNIDHRLDWTRKTKTPHRQNEHFLNQDNATAYLRNHAVNLDDMQPKYRTNEYYMNDDQFDDNYRPVPIQIPQRQQYGNSDLKKKRRPIGFRNNMPIYDLTQTKIDTQPYEQSNNNYIHKITSTLRPGGSISYEVEIPLLSTKPTKVRIRPSKRPDNDFYSNNNNDRNDNYGNYRPQNFYSTTTRKPELQTFYSVVDDTDNFEDNRPFQHGTYSYRPPLQTTPRPIFASTSSRPASVTLDPLSFFMASTTALSSLYNDSPDTDYTNTPSNSVKVQSTFVATLGNNYPTLNEPEYTDDTNSDPDILHIPPHLIPEVDEKYFFNDKNWEKVDSNKRHDTGKRPRPQQQTYTPAYVDYSQYNQEKEQNKNTKFYYVDNILHKVDAYGDVYRKKEGRRYAETFGDKNNDQHWIRVTRQVHMNDLTSDMTGTDKDLETNDKNGKTLQRKNLLSDTAFVSLVVLNSAERPDNWVNTEPKNLRIKLPEMPFLPDERHTATEFPRPIRLNFNRKQK